MLLAVGHCDVGLVSIQFFPRLAVQRPSFKDDDFGKALRSLDYGHGHKISETVGKAPLDLDALERHEWSMGARVIH